MEYLKLFEDFNLYKQIGNDEFFKRMGSIIKVTDGMISKISSTFPSIDININKNSYRILIPTMGQPRKYLKILSYIFMKKNNSTFFMAIPLIDEYFIVRIVRNGHFDSEIYLCDGYDGLEYFIKKFLVGKTSY